MKEFGVLLHSASKTIAEEGTIGFILILIVIILGAFYLFFRFTDTGEKLLKSIWRSGLSENNSANPK